MSEPSPTRPDATDVVRVVVRRNTYVDSVALLQVSADLVARPGVRDAAVVMATELNRDLLASSGLLVAEALDTGANDLVVAIRAADASAADAAVERATALLSARRPAATEVGTPEPPRSIRSAVRRSGPEANLAFISVPGPYAAAEARQALLAGLHVLVFSDNVPLEEEVALKALGRQLGLLVMGPDCGTAILNGIGLGFANVVRRGRIGIVGASGTGVQEVSVLVHAAGEGVSQAIGTGGRDLHERVGGATTLRGLEILGTDPETQAIVLVSKPPSPAVARRVLAAAVSTGKPVVACLLGAEIEPLPGARIARTLADTAVQAVRAVGGTPRLRSARPVQPALSATQRQVRGLYCGGTLCEEAASVVGDRDHVFVDFGDDRYTRGRAHPMIDPTLRHQAILEAAADPRVAVILLDVILGLGAHPDPAGALAPVLREATRRAEDAGRRVALIAHVVGTEADPQGIQRQAAALRAAGAQLFPSNHAAAVAARQIAAREGG